MSDWKRSSGILLHPTSLPGRYGIGEIGPAAYRFADFLASSGQKSWQVLPLGPTGFGNSPYQCLSAFAGNCLLVSPEKLLSDGLLNEKDLANIPRFPVERVDFQAVISFKNSLLKRAFHNFKARKPGKLVRDFQSFIKNHSHWLDDYALYQSIKDVHGGAPWIQWPAALARRQPEALESALKELSGEIEANKFYQFLFFSQWQRLREYCRLAGIEIIGDVPIFVSYDSADVWAHRHLFKLNKDGSLKLVAGVPPDYFSATGQRWGNPVYQWSRLRQEDYRFWVERVRSALEMTDTVRIDHFRGFAACWEIPANEPTAVKGNWVKAPGREIFQVLKKELGTLPIIAEDLGVITPDVVALREEFGFPGMRIFQFAFGGKDSHDLPHNYVPHTVAYTGTHDNDTAVGWFNSKAGAGSTRTAVQIKRERAYCLQYLNSEGKEIHWDFIRAVLASVAERAIIPLQDVLGLGSSARMNIPATEEGNWSWRFTDRALTAKLGAKLKRMTELYGRDR